MKLLLALLCLLPTLVFGEVKLTADSQCSFQIDDSSKALCVASYEYSADGGTTWSTMTSIVAGESITLMHPLGSFPDGQNVIEVRGANAWGRSASVPFSFVKGVPATPSNGLRLVSD